MRISTKSRASFAGREKDFNPKDALRDVLGREQYGWRPTWTCADPAPGGLAKIVTAVGLPRCSCRSVELHRHAKSRTDQFPMYVVGEADAFSIGEDAQPVLTPVTGGDHFHNSPDAPHAFLPKVGKPIPDNWEIAFIAITPRNLREDTQSVSDDVRAAYKRVVGMDAPLGV